ncbi:MAG: F0F1 ATP synthase subunit epsilon [Gammaproteobacteria bacterium]|nr:F0F1 ATP synthase subunit epsilon [Gammaproteobacteria bacterium]
MNGFTIQLQSPTMGEVINDVVSFVGEDVSGSFGIMANHERMMTILEFGLVWFRHSNDEVEYLALLGGVLYFVNNRLIINTRHYLRGDNYQEMVASLEKKLLQEEKSISDLKGILHNLDRGILRHLQEIKQVDVL